MGADDLYAVLEGAGADAECAKGFVTVVKVIFTADGKGIPKAEGCILQLHARSWSYQ